MSPSDILLFSIFLYILIEYLRSPHRGVSLGLATGFSAVLSSSLKLLFRIPREKGIDPFAFPSIHTATAFAPYFYTKSIPLLIVAVSVAVFRVIEGYHSLFDVFGGILTSYVSIKLYSFIESRLKERGMRKIMHVVVTFIPGYLMLFLPQIAVSSIVLAGAVLIYLLKEHNVVSPVYNMLSRKEGDKGPLTASFSMFLGSLVGAGPVVAFVLAFVDGLSAITGMLLKPYGKKTLEGLIGGVVGSIITMILLRGFYDPVYLFSLSLLSPVVEYFSKIDDNISLGIFVTVFHVLVKA